jgi:hypothetical protein
MKTWVVYITRAILARSAAFTMPMNINPITDCYQFSHYSQTHRRHAPYTSSRPSTMPTR